MRNKRNEENNGENIIENTTPSEAEETAGPEVVCEVAQLPEENLLADELAAEKDRYLRLAAEYDNFRKRSLKERESFFVDVRSETIVKILPVYDNLARALKLETADLAFYKGVEMTMAQLKEIFEKMGVTEIPAEGEKFDPSLHNAVMHIEDANYGEGEIVEEFEKGFKLGDKVIRFSLVKVAN